MIHRTISQKRLYSTSGSSQYQFLIIFFVIMLLTLTQSFAQPAKNANKFLGNVTTRNQVRNDFMEYWNCIAGENECQWLSVESQRNKMVWDGFDRIATFAREHKIPWRFHSLFTSGNYPAWMAGLSDTALLREIGEWMDAAAARYPDVTMIDVINEGYLNNFAGILKRALGGNGVTGFDWAIKVFKMARERWPHALLMYNDYNNIEYEDYIKWTIDLVTALKQANAPIDVIGCEANYTMNIATSRVKVNIDRIAELGLPIHISAFEIASNTDSIQESLIREKFTMLWNHPKVIGITYWGYVVGQTGHNGTGLLTNDGVERPALTWLKNFVKDNPNPPNDFPHLLDRTTDVQFPNNPGYTCVRAEFNSYRVRSGVFDLQGRCINRCINMNIMNDIPMERGSSGVYLKRPAGCTGITTDFDHTIEIK